VALAPIVMPVTSRRRDLWAWTTGDHRYLPDNPLNRLTSRTVTRRLVGNHEASFTLDAALPESGNIDELISDLWVLRNSVTLFRGRIGATSDTCDGTTHTATFSASDYRAVLNRRLIYDADTKTWTSVDQGQIAWNLLNQTQAKTGGALGVVRGQQQTTGTVASPTFEPGATVTDSIDSLANSTAAFDYDITPKTGTLTQTFDLWTPRGTDRQRVVAYPGDVASFTRQVDPSVFANALRATGGQDASNNDLAPVSVAASTIGADPAGRWDAQFADTDIKTAALLSSRAQAQLAAGQNVTPAWVVTLNPESWGGLNDIDVGDPIILRVKSGYRLNVDETLRVYEMAITLDDESDAATVALTLGAPPPNRKWLFRTVDRRLQKLERR
jgi:hypothetical protein